MGASAQWGSSRARRDEILIIPVRSQTTEHNEATYPGLDDA